MPSFFSFQSREEDRLLFSWRTYLAPRRGRPTNYDQRICRPYVGLPVRLHISKTIYPKLIKFSVRVNCGRGSSFSDDNAMLPVSVNDVILSLNGAKYRYMLAWSLRCRALFSATRQVAQLNCALGRSLLSSTAVFGSEF